MAIRNIVKEGDPILRKVCRPVDQFDEKQLTDYRRYDIGFVFQFYNLVQNLTAYFYE